MKGKKAYSIPGVSVVTFDEDVSALAGSTKCYVWGEYRDEYVAGQPPCSKIQTGMGTDDTNT